MMYLCREHKVQWVGVGERTRALEGLGHRGARVTPAYRHPPVEPALCHRGFPTVAGEGWGARSRALAAAAGPGHPPDCVLARGGPPPVSPPHHGEVTRPWAVVGVKQHIDQTFSSTLARG